MYLILTILCGLYLGMNVLFAIVVILQMFYKNILIASFFALWILVAFLKIISCISCSLSDICDVFWCVCVGSSFIPFKIKSSFVLCSQANILLVYLWFHFWISWLSLVTNRMYACFFVDVYLCDCCLPRNLYTWEKLHLLLISYFLVSPFYSPFYS